MMQTYILDRYQKLTQVVQSWPRFLTQHGTSAPLACLHSQLHQMWLWLWTQSSCSPNHQVYCFQANPNAYPRGQTRTGYWPPLCQSPCTSTVSPLADPHKSLLYCICRSRWYLCRLAAFGMTPNPWGKYEWCRSTAEHGTVTRAFALWNAKSLNHAEPNHLQEREVTLYTVGESWPNSYKKIKSAVIRQNTLSSEA